MEQEKTPSRVWQIVRRIPFGLMILSASKVIN
jgi:hypothetical protein